MNDLELMEEWLHRIKEKRAANYMTSLPTISPLKCESFYSTMKDNKFHHVVKIKDNFTEEVWIDGVKQGEDKQKQTIKARTRKKNTKREKLRAKRRKS